MTGIQEAADNYSIGRIISEQAIYRADNPALVGKNQDTCTYSAMDAISMKVSRSLLSLNIPARSHIAIWEMNSPAWVYAMLGAVRTGHPFIGLNTGYQSDELYQILSHSSSVVLFIGDKTGKCENFYDILYRVCPDAKETPHGGFRSDILPALQYVVSLTNRKNPGILTWDEFLAMGDTVPEELVHSRESSVFPDDLAMIMYTSGTTGKPKGVMHSHRDLVLNSYLISERLDLSKSDIACIPVPFFHIFGITLLFTSFGSGGAVCPLERFSARDLLLMIQSSRATILYGVVSMFAAVLEELKRERYDLASLKGGIISASRCPASLVRQVIDVMEMPGFVIGYGSTEGICITLSRSDDSLVHKTETLGFPLSGAEIKIIDPKTGSPVATGQIGEAWVKSPWIMKGYYQMPDETNRVLDTDEFYHTGDLLSVDEDGYVRFIGRIDELIKRGSENVYAIEIEEPLRLHPAVVDARVIGIPCVYYGEDIVAFVIMKPGTQVPSQEIKKYLRSIIAMYKVPSAIVFLKQFPLTGSGKVRLAALREMAVAARDKRPGNQQEK